VLVCLDWFYRKTEKTHFGGTAMDICTLSSAEEVMATSADFCFFSHGQLILMGIKLAELL
jgi:hypothetical protein